MGNFFSFSFFYTTMGINILFTKAFYRWSTCTNTINLYTCKLFPRCINKWSTVFITQNTCLYVLLAFMCLLFAPTSNNKMSLSSTQKKLHKIISILIIFTGLLIFYKIGHSNLTATIFYSFLCAIILMLIETILHLRINLFH